jgi:hypothetical protein
MCCSGVITGCSVVCKSQFCSYKIECHDMQRTVNCSEDKPVRRDEIVPQALSSREETVAVKI